MGTAYAGSVGNQSIVPYANGGEGPFSWKLISGSLPPGIVLAQTTNFSTDNTSGALSGTPTAPGTYSFTLQVTDGSSTPLTATQTYSIGVAAFGQYAEPDFGAPTTVVTGPDQALWYNLSSSVLSDQQGNSLFGIGRVTTSGVFTSPPYPLPQIASNGVQQSPEALQIVTGSDGNLWILSPISIEQISTKGNVGFSYSIPQTFGGTNSSTIVNSIAAGPDGAIWFTVYSVFGNPYAAIGRLGVTDHSLKYYPISTNPNSSPQGIAAGPDGYLWFTDSGLDQNGTPLGYIGRMSIDGVLTPPTGCAASPTMECAIPGSSFALATSFFSYPAVFPSVTPGPDGAMWFTDPSSSQVGRISIDGSSVSLYADPATANGQVATPSEIISGPDGALWFADPATLSAGRVTVLGVVTEFSVPTTTPVSGIAVGSDHAIWLADGTNIDRLLPPLSLSCDLSSSLRVGISLPVGTGCTAFAGSAPYTYSIKGTLPPGVTFNTSTGALTGVPNGAGSYTFSIVANDNSTPAETANEVVNVTVAPRQPLTFTCSFPAGAQVTVPYTASCATAGGDAPYVYSVSAGTLPAGLTLTPTSTGVNITGIPTSYGTFAFTIQAVDGGTPQFVATHVEVAFAVLPPPLRATCNFSAKAEINVPYLSSCNVSGGVAPYTITTPGTAAPSWLIPPTSPATSFTGTPTAPAGSSSFVVQVQDSGPPKQTVSLPVKLTVIPAKLGVMCDFSAIVTVGTPFATSCTTENGAGPYQFKVTNGGLPSGLILNSSTGKISGTPSAAALFQFTVQVTDHDSPVQTAIQNVNLRVSSVLLKIINDTLPDGAMNLPYSGNPLAEGGKPPYSWTVKSGSLPAGLTLAPTTGAITGTPTASGNYSFTLQVADSGSRAKQTATQAFSGTVSLPFVENFTEYPLPSASGPSGITAGPNGALWFDTLNQSAGNLIGQITTAGAVTTYPAPNPLGNTAAPGGITTGPDGTIWFAEGTSDRVGQLSADGTFSIDYPVTTSANPTQMATGPDGAVWFTESGLSQVGRISPSGTVLSEFSTTTPASGPAGVVMGPDNALWFTERVGDRIGRITTTGKAAEYAIPTTGAAPATIALGPDGALWFTENGGSGKIGRITTTGVVTEFATPTPASGPLGIAAGADGALYFTEANVNQIGRITTDGKMTEYSIPSNGSGLAGLALGSDGNIWIAESGANKIVRFTFVTELLLVCSFPSSTAVAIGSTYSGSCQASRGVAPYTYSVSKGALPPGVTLNPSDRSSNGNSKQTWCFHFHSPGIRQQRSRPERYQNIAPVHCETRCSQLVLQPAFRSSTNRPGFQRKLRTARRHFSLYVLRCFRITSNRSHLGPVFGSYRRSAQCARNVHVYGPGERFQFACTDRSIG